MQSTNSIKQIILATSLLGCIPAIAGNEIAAPAASSSDASGLLLGKLTGKTPWDQAWSAATLYKDNSNPILEEFDLTGRAQFDYFNVDSNKGNNDFLEVRRVRMGVDSFWFERFLEVKATLDTNLRTYGQEELFYNRMTDLFVNLHFNDAFNLRVGKFEPHFGYDREFSDTQQVFFERSFFDDNVFNKTGNDYLTGASAMGKIGKWGYQAAVFSNQVGQEFGHFHGGYSYLGELNYDFSKDLQAKKALLAMDIMHMTTNANSNVFNTMENAAAVYFDYQQSKYGLVTQLGYGNGIDTKGDIYELMIMPTYKIMDELELVFRYQLGLADNDNGISVINRQEKTIGKSTGSLDNILYLGLNYYLYGQKCKLMAGEQYDDLSGGTGANANVQAWTTLVGFRMYF